MQLGKRPPLNFPLKPNQNQWQHLRGQNFLGSREAPPNMVRARKKVLSSCSGQVDSPSGQLTFHSYSALNGQRDQSSCLPTKSLKEQTKTCVGQANFKGYLSQVQAGIQVFFKP